MDLAVLQAVTRELDEALRGAFINKVYQPLPREILLAVRLPGGGGGRVALSADPLLGRIHLTDLKIANPPRPPRFCAFLRAHVQGGRILAVKAASDDRVVRIATARGKDSDRTELDLVLELLGRDSNILVVDRSSNVILDCLHRIARKETTTRVVLPGAVYEPPPQSPTRREPTGPDYEDGMPSPGIAFGPGGRERLVARSVPGRDTVFPTMNAAAEAFYAKRLAHLLLEAAKREEAAPLRSRIRSLDKRMEKIRADSDRLERFAVLEEEGGLLKANLRRVTKGMDRIVVQDWATGSDRTIALDSALGPVANLEKMFKKVAKAKRGRIRVNERMVETIEEKRALEELLYFVEQATDLEDLEGIGVPHRPSGGRGVSPDTSHRKALSEEARLVRTFQAPSGRLVLVGRSGRGNDYLLRRKASKEDLWFHVSQVPGAHVVLATGGAESSPEEVAFCAALAVTYSKARGKGKTEVIVTRVKDIERPKGALPGQVRVKKYKTLLAEGSEPPEG